MARHGRKGSQKVQADGNSERKQDQQGPTANDQILHRDLSGKQGFEQETPHVRHGKTFNRQPPRNNLTRDSRESKDHNCVSVGMLASRQERNMHSSINTRGVTSWFFKNYL
jgi:hypothetical protein